MDIGTLIVTTEDVTSCDVAHLMLQHLITTIIYSQKLDIGKIRSSGEAYKSTDMHNQLIIAHYRMR